MNKEQLEKINTLIGKINELQKILEIKTDKLKIEEYNEIHYRHIKINNGIAISPLIIRREILETAITSYCEKLRNELKELGYEA